MPTINTPPTKELKKFHEKETFIFGPWQLWTPIYPYNFF